VVILEMAPQFKMYSCSNKRLFIGNMLQAQQAASAKVLEQQKVLEQESIGIVTNLQEEQRLQ
jgi:hypothetical protein